MLPSARTGTRFTTSHCTYVCAFRLILGCTCTMAMQMLEGSSSTSRCVPCDDIRANNASCRRGRRWRPATAGGDIRVRRLDAGRRQQQLPAGDERPQGQQALLRRRLPRIRFSNGGNTADFVGMCTTTVYLCYTTCTTCTCMYTCVCVYACKMLY